MSEDITGLDLDAIDARAKGATPGPWVARENVPTWVADGHDPGPNGWELHAPSTPLLDAAGEFCKDDAAHIAGMDPTTTIALVARVRRLEKALCDAVTAAESQNYPDHGKDEYRRGQHRGAMDATEMVRRVARGVLGTVL